MYKYNLAVMAMFKNEDAYIPEWLEYHRKIGVEHFYLYDNNHDKCIDFRSSSDITDYIWMHKTQTEAIYHCIKNCQTKWLAIIDLDEFIYMPKGFLDSFDKPNIGSVYLHWKCFGSSGRILDGKTLSLFKCAPNNYYKNQNIKSIVRPERCTLEILNTHYFSHKLGSGAVNCLGKPLMPYRNVMKPYPPVLYPARIHHYPIRSMENLVMKTKRGYTGFAVKEHYLRDYQQIYDNSFCNMDNDNSMETYL